MKIHIYKAKDGWRWRAVARNGRIVADGGEGYVSKGNTERAVKADIKSMGTAKIAQDSAMLASARITVRQEVIETVGKQAEDAVVAKIKAAVADDPALDQKAKDALAAIVSASTAKAEPK